MAVVARPVVGLRSGPRTQSELVTQEVWGRRLMPLRSRGDWLYCEAADGMTGWVPASSVAESESYSPTHVVSRRFARLKRGKRNDVLLPMGSLVAADGVSGTSVRALDPRGATGKIGAINLRRLRAGRVGPHRPVGVARAGTALDGLIPEVIGTPYLWGGKSTFGFDCSGLVQVLFEFLGVRLPRDSGDQAATGRRVKSLSSIRPLDLIFFSRRGRVDHVAIHLGDLVMLHASGHVRLESLDEAAPDFRADLRERFAWATRPIT